MFLALQIAYGPRWPEFDAEYRQFREWFCSNLQVTGCHFVVISGVP